MAHGAIYQPRLSRFKRYFAVTVRGSKLVTRAFCRTWRSARSGGAIIIKNGPMSLTNIQDMQARRLSCGDVPHLILLKNPPPPDPHCTLSKTKCTNLLADRTADQPTVRGKVPCQAFHQGRRLRIENDTKGGATDEWGPSVKPASFRSCNRLPSAIYHRERRSFTMLNISVSWFPVYSTTVFMFHFGIDWDSIFE